MAVTPSPRFAAYVLATLALSWGGTTTLTAYPTPSTNCTEAASKAASWEVRNFTFDTDTRFYYGPGTAGTVTFSIKNAVNGYQFDCLQGNGQEVRRPNHYLQGGQLWYSCNTYCSGSGYDYPPEDSPPLDTAFHYDINTKTLSVRQRWTCGGQNNNTEDAIFSATGSSVLANIKCSQMAGGRTDQISCSPVDAIIRASNVAHGDTPFTPDAEPLYTIPPAGNQNRLPATTKPVFLHNSPGCTKRSSTPSWFVSDFYSTGLGSRFTLTNQALNYTARCNLGDLTSNVEQKFASAAWWNCSRYDSSHATYPYDGIYTEVLYGGSQNILGINQTWYCDDEEASAPIVFNAFVESKFLFNCTERKECYEPELPGAAPVMTINNRCYVANMTLTPTKLANFHVSPSQATAFFTPHGYNCTAQSLGKSGKPVWEVSGFSFNRTWNPNWDRFMDEVEFTYNNTATDYEWPMTTRERFCYDQSSMLGPSFDGSRQLTCSNSASVAPGFRFDFNSSTLTLDQQWRCDGMDREHSNVFDAQGSAKLPLVCKAAGNGTLCSVRGTFQVAMLNWTQTLDSPNTDYRGFGI